MNQATKYPPESIEHLIQTKLTELIILAKEQIYTTDFKQMPEFYSEENDLDTLGIIISKHCEWIGEKIKQVAVSSFEDANFHSWKVVDEDWLETYHNFAALLGGSIGFKRIKLAEGTTSAYEVAKEMTDNFEALPQEEKGYENGDYLECIQNFFNNNLEKYLTL